MATYLEMKFALQTFERKIKTTDDIEQLRVIAIELFAQVQSQRLVYESMLNSPD